jgi:hypothetical protein
MARILQHCFEQDVFRLIADGETCRLELNGKFIESFPSEDDAIRSLLSSAIVDTQSSRVINPSAMNIPSSPEDWDRVQ